MKKINIAIIGGGHAGIEAALAISRMGEKCSLITMDLDSIGRMSCNPAIGGLAKGHLVREIDALGGVMGLAADKTAIQFKTLNKSKGRAVWSPRAQVDKIKYSSFVKNVVIKDENINVLAGEVVDITVDKGGFLIINLLGGAIYQASSLIVTTGTFLGGKIHVGSNTFSAGRFAEPPSRGITKSLNNLGLKSIIIRFYSLGKLNSCSW